MPENLKWTIMKGGAKKSEKTTPKVPYVSTWATFSKLDEKMKETIFNAMRQALIAAGMMENKGG